MPAAVQLPLRCRLRDLLNSLQFKLTFAIAGITLGVVWALAIYTAARLEAEIKAIAMDKQFAAVQYLALELDQKVKERLDGLRGIAAGLDLSHLNDPAYLQAFLESRYVLQRQFTGGTAIIGTDGRTIADYPVVPGRRGTYFGDRDYFTQAAATRKPYIDKPIMGRALKRPVMTLSTPLIDADGTFRGVMTGIIDLTAPSFLGLMNDRRILGDIEFFVISPRHSVFIATSDAKRTLTATPAPGASEIYDAVLAGFEGTMVSTNSQRIEKVYAVKRVPTTDWVVELALPTETAFRPAVVMRERLYSAALLASLIAMLIVGLIARHLLRPLESAAARLDDMSAGRAELERLPETGDAEIRRLLTSFNRLTGHLTQQQAELRESEATYRSLFENMLNGFAYCRMLYEDGKPVDFVYLGVNEAFGTLTGLQDVVGRRVSEVIPGIREQDAALLDLYGRVATGGKPERFEYHLSSLDMWLSVSVYAPKPEHFVAVFEVITERKQQEQQIIDLNRTLEARVQRRTEDLERANRELEGFSYSISHDLRAPLRAINGFSSLLLENERERLTADGIHMLERVAGNAARMGELIDDILEYSRSGRIEIRKTEVDMDALAREVIDQMRDCYPAAQFDCGPLPRVRGDATMLRQVLLNLIDNAAKFSAQREHPHVQIDCASGEHEHAFRVRDNGAGFDMRYVDNLFGMFRRLHTEEQFPGTGIGLAIVKRLVERHGGTVRAESEDGRGATFYFTLPASAA